MQIQAILSAYSCAGRKGIHYTYTPCPSHFISLERKKKKREKETPFSHTRSENSNA